MSTLEPAPIAPDIPTMADTIPGFEASSWHGVFPQTAAAARSSPRSRPR